MSNTIRRRIFVVIIGVLWIVMVFSFVVAHEFTIRTGTDILLKVDPQFQSSFAGGNYIDLWYDGASRVELNDHTFSDFYVHDTVYVALDVNDKGIGTVTEIRHTKPSTAPFMKGTVSTVHVGGMYINYGIKNYFMHNRTLTEDEQDTNDAYARVAIDRFGNVVIKSLIINGKDINE